MRLLLFIHSLRCGGAERAAASLANYWSEKGWDVMLATLEGAEHDFYELRPQVTRVALDLAGNSGNALVGAWRNVRRARALRRALSDHRPEVALAMMSSASVLLAISAVGMPWLSTIGAERSYPPRMPMGFLWERLRRITYGRLSAVTALTAETASWLRTNTSARRVDVIPGVAKWPLPAQGPLISPGASVPAQTRVLLAAGRLSEEKQLRHLIDAFAELAGTHPNWVLVFVGEGPERPALERRASTAGLRGRVVFAGRVGNVGDWYERADLYAMTSRYEGFPNTLAEAMAYGLPGVSYDCDTGPRDLIRSEVDGLLVPPDDQAALAAALDRLMGDDALRKRFGSRAGEVRDRFSEARITDMWEQLFLSLRREAAGQ